jgi:IS5 family transposase
VAAELEPAERGHRLDALERRDRRGFTTAEPSRCAAASSRPETPGGRPADPSSDSAVEEHQWYFGLKAHIGLDAKSGLAGKVHHAEVMANLVREDDTAVYGANGFASDAKTGAAQAAGVLGA